MQSITAQSSWCQARGKKCPKPWSKKLAHKLNHVWFLALYD